LAFKNGVKSIQTAGYNGAQKTFTKPAIAIRYTALLLDPPSFRKPLTPLQCNKFKLTFGISVASLEISRISACSIVSVLPSVIVFLVALKTIAFARSSVLIEALLDL
jgi:hypothetical protein